MLVLAMDVDQTLAQLFDLLQRRRPAIHVRARPSTRFENATQQADSGLVRQVVAVQPLRHAGQIVDGKLGADLRARAALAHQAGIAALAQHQGQGIDQDRLAGAGLPGERGEARLELEVEAVDDDEVADA